MKCHSVAVCKYKYTNTNRNRNSEESIVVYLGGFQHAVVYNCESARTKYSTSSVITAVMNSVIYILASQTIRRTKSFFMDLFLSTHAQVNI